MNAVCPQVIGIYEPSASPGGQSRYVHSILNAIDFAEFRVIVFTHVNGPYAPREGIEILKICGNQTAGQSGDGICRPAARSLGRFGRASWSRIAPGPLRIWGGYAKASRALSRHFRSRHIDLLHTHQTGCEESPIAARIAGIRPVIGTFHIDPTYDLHRQRSGVTHRLVEVVSNQCLDRAIAVSRATKEMWVRRTGIAAKRVTTIYNGIDPDRFQRRYNAEHARGLLGLPRSGMLIGGIGRLDEAKGFIHLIEALALLVGKYPQLDLVLAGQGPQHEVLAARAGQLGISNRVHFLGFCNDVQVVYDALDVFVLPSLCETLGYVLLEAMATRLPVIGSRVGGIPEVIVNGETGFVVPCRNPVGIAKAAQELLDSRELRERLGNNGRERVIRHFHETEMARRTLDLYRSVLQTQRTRSLENGLPLAKTGQLQSEGTEASSSRIQECVQ